jgi:dTDP-4-amino-4,6-dideoxygalactose transaminase
MEEPLKIPFNKPFIVGKELFYIAQAVIENHHTAGDGPFTKKCQAWLEARLGCCGSGNGGNPRRYSTRR